MIIQLRYILDIPYQNLMPKMGIFLACTDALQHLRKEIVLIWKNPPVFEDQIKNAWDAVWRTRTPTNIDSKLRHEYLCPSLYFYCGMGADTQVVWTALQSSYSLFFKSSQQLLNLLDAQHREYYYPMKWVQHKHCQHQHLHNLDKGSSPSAKADRSSELMFSAEAVAARLKVDILSSGVWQNKTCTVCMFPLLQNTQ